MMRMGRPFRTFRVWAFQNDVRTIGTRWLVVSVYVRLTLFCFIVALATVRISKNQPPVLVVSPSSSTREAVESEK